MTSSGAEEGGGLGVLSLVIKQKTLVTHVAVFSMKEPMGDQRPSKARLSPGWRRFIGVIYMS